MTLKEKGRKPTPDMPATGVGPSLTRYIVNDSSLGGERILDAEEVLSITSLILDRALIPAKSKTEWRVVVTVPGQRQQRYPKRNAERAQKAIADFAKDRARSVYYRDATMHIEQREVTEWHTQ